MVQLKDHVALSSLPRAKSPDRRTNRLTRKKNRGLRVARVFSDPTVPPFDQVEWERRTAEITDDSGKIIFKQEDIEVPKSWSALATNTAPFEFRDSTAGNRPLRLYRGVYSP